MLFSSTLLQKLINFWYFWRIFCLINLKRGKIPGFKKSKIYLCQACLVNIINTSGSKKKSCKRYSLKWNILHMRSFPSLLQFFNIGDLKKVVRSQDFWWFPKFWKTERAVISNEIPILALFAMRSPCWTGRISLKFYEIPPAKKRRISQVYPKKWTYAILSMKKKWTTIFVDF